MVRMISVIVLFLNLYGCKSNAQPCDSKINELPMYGGVQKCPELIATDNDFVQIMDKQYPSRNLAAKEMVRLGWDYLYQKDVNTAMKRFNQAWMLDSLNADVYWGFASVEGYRQHFDDAEKLFLRAIALDSTNVNLYLDYATTLGNLYALNENQNKLDDCMRILDKVIDLDKNNARAYSQKAICYYYLNDYKNAKKMIALTESIDPDMIDINFKKLISKD